LARQNSFDFIRLCAALGVLVGHQFIISGAGPAWGITNQNISEIPLHVFFSLSGFLIYQSLQRSNDLASFVAARVTRIGPTLVGALVLASGFTLFYFQNYDHLINHIKYIYRNAFFMFRVLSDQIPGIFEANPTPRINSPLWTLAYEVWLYFSLYLVFRLPRSARIWAIVAILIALNFCWVRFEVNEAQIPLTPLFPMRLGRLGCFFFAGALVAAVWPAVKGREALVGIVGLCALGVLLATAPASAGTALALALAMAGLGSASLLAPFSRGGDASYGVYVFAWPVQQTYQTIFPDFWTGLGFSLVTTIALGYATWHLYEKRCIARRRQVADVIRFRPSRLVRAP
jgi:peptidoglycan/LPS O-acetylase OafA/YrhL